MSFLKRVSLIFLLTLSCTVKGNEDSGEGKIFLNLTTLFNKLVIASCGT